MTHNRPAGFQNQFPQIPANPAPASAPPEGLRDFAREFHWPLWGQKIPQSRNRAFAAPISRRAEDADNPAGLDFEFPQIPANPAESPGRKRGKQWNEPRAEEQPKPRRRPSRAAARDWQRPLDRPNPQRRSET